MEPLSRADPVELGGIEVRDHQVLLGRPMRFTKANVDQFDF